MYIGFCTASIALFTDLEIVLEMISMGTLAVFFLVANALIYRRYAVSGRLLPSRVLLFLLLLSAASLGFSLTWSRSPWAPPLFAGAALSLVALLSYSAGDGHVAPPPWSVPFMPWPPALSIFLNVFLITTLKKLSFQRFAVWTVLITLFYVLYGVHRTYEAEEMGTRGGSDGGDGLREDGVVINVSSVQQQAKLDNIQLVVPVVVTQV